MNINHKCVKKIIVIWLFFLCKTLDINETFFLTPWSTGVRSDLNSCGVSTQLTHSSVSSRQRCQIYITWGEKKRWKRKRETPLLPKTLITFITIVVSSYIHSILYTNRKKTCPMFQRAFRLYSLRHCNKAHARLTASQLNLDANRWDCYIQISALPAFIQWSSSGFVPCGKSAQDAPSHN